MKSIIFLMLGMFIITSSIAQTSSPCDDLKFLELKKRGVENLSESEMTYYSQKEKECDQYLKASQNNSKVLAQVNSEINQKNNTEKQYQARKTKRKISTWFWVTVFGAAVYFAYQHDMGN